MKMLQNLYTFWALYNMEIKSQLFHIWVKVLVQNVCVYHHYIPCLIEHYNLLSTIMSCMCVCNPYRELNRLQGYMSLPNIVFVLELIYCVVKVANIACTTSRNTCAANIAIEWLPYSYVWENKFGYKSELKVKFKNPSNQPSSFCTFCMSI